MKSIFYNLIILVLIIGCNSDIKKDSIYFGGQIKNPKDNTVLIFKGDKQVASTKLSSNHKFMFKLDSLQTGLYKFKHGEEYQYIYFEEKDSLLIRLNTWDFDGSLVFSGKGANRNNFLIQLFLENEQEEREFFNYFKLDENSFLLKVDSLIKLKNIQFKQFQEHSIKQSGHFNELIDAAIYFPIYSNKEKYPLHYKHYHHTDKLPKLSNDFYKHRTDVEKNQNLFKNYYTYKNYLWNKIYNISLYQIEKDTLSELSSVLLHQISKLVTNEDLKNSMLQQTFINSLFDSSCSNKDKEKTKHLFFNTCNDDIKKEKVSKILKVINTLTKNSKLPEFYLKTPNNQVINSKDLLGNNTVIYFWPKEPNRIKNMAKRIHFLMKKYPKLKFIGIDGQLNNAIWKNLSKANKLNFSYQYQLMDINKNAFYTNDFPRAVVINKKGIIQNNFTFISHRNFEEILQGLENN
jgi:hypothetical protein